MKYVQTSVPDNLHRKLLKIAKQEGKSLKDIIREALEDWVVWRYDLTEDPFINSKPYDFGVITDSSNIKKQIYSTDTSKA